MRRIIVTTTVALAIAGLSLPALAAQPVIVTPSAAPLLPVVLYEIDYATAGRAQTPFGLAKVDTLVSIGLPAASLAKGCNIQVAWFDWNNAPAGVSGAVALAAGWTFEFTTSVNHLTPVEYPPFQENVFRNNAVPFEGHAQIRTDAACAAKALRVDAEFVIETMTAAGTVGAFAYKPINVTNTAGNSGE